MTDRIIAASALMTLIVFLATIPIFVPEIDLILVVVFVCSLAIWDFWDSLRAPRADDSE